MSARETDFPGVFTVFAELPEPRVERTRKHPLINILAISLLGMICVGEGWDDMHEFGEAKKEWLSEFLDLRNGIPCADTFRRVLSALDPVAFNASFIQWVQALSKGSDGKLIAIDGKTLRHSFDHASGRKALHLVSAWIADNKLSLGQIATEEKSNEVTAIPGLLELLDIKGATITIDAMGCQRAIAEKIIEQGGDYIMGLKGNQGTALNEVQKLFKRVRNNDFRELPFTYHETTDGSEHGRIEVRRMWVSQDVESFFEHQKWRGLSSFIMVERERTVNSQTSKEVQYYWSSHQYGAEEFSSMIRRHWSIENELHWCLDVAFREDESRIRSGHGPENIALLRKIAMNLAKNERSSKRGIQAKRKRAAWDESYLLKLLQAGLPEKAT